MTDLADTPQTAAQAGQTQAVPFDRAQLFQRSLNALARFERLYDAARKRLERARRAEDFLAYLIGSKRVLIEKLLGMWFTAEDLADMLIEEMGDIPVARKKIIAAIKKCGTGDVGDENSGKKRRGRPPRNATVDAATDAQDAAQPSGQISAGTGNSEKISTQEAGNSTVNFQKNARNLPGNFSALSEKSTAQDEKVRTKTAISGEKQDSEERQQRLRRKAPTWADGYGDDPKYGPIVVRREGESEPDYFWRMWHTAPPWADEQPRSAQNESLTQWIQKCWSLTSPEERAAHQASLPSTAR